VLLVTAKLASFEAPNALLARVPERIPVADALRNDASGKRMKRRVKTLLRD
jgi:hypothetical protein